MNGAWGRLHLECLKNIQSMPCQNQSQGVLGSGIHFPCSMILFVKWQNSISLSFSRIIKTFKHVKAA